MATYTNSSWFEIRQWACSRCNSTNLAEVLDEHNEPVRYVCQHCGHHWAPSLTYKVEKVVMHTMPTKSQPQLPVPLTETPSA